MVRSHPSGHGLSCCGSSCKSVDSGAQCQHNGAFSDFLSQFRRMLLTKNADDASVTQKYENKVRGHYCSVLIRYLMCLCVRVISFIFQKERFQYFRHGRGNMTDLTSDDLHEKSADIYKMLYTISRLKSTLFHLIQAVGNLFQQFISYSTYG